MCARDTAPYAVEREVEVGASDLAAKARCTEQLAALLSAGDRGGAAELFMTVVDGGASPSAMREATRRVAQAVRRGRHRTLTGQVHDVAPHVLAPVLEEFFAG